ncbi:MAG: DUF3310 domain-containing protein [Proteobacteria bacterium]|nr:MAG: DUF3310 domain-containing protein [Pseudomonadota bacterium]
MPNCLKDGWGGRCPDCSGECVNNQSAQEKASALATQVGGTHYKDMAIQPVEYIHRNSIGFVEGAVIKYVSRWRAKNGVEDLKKARHMLDLLIEMEGGVGHA